MTTHTHTDQSGTYVYAVEGDTFTVEYDGGEQCATMRAWHVQEWDTIAECPVDDTLTMIDGGSIIYLGIAYDLAWN